MVKSKRCTGFTRNFEERFYVKRSTRECFAPLDHTIFAAGTNNETFMLAKCTVMIHH